MRVRTVTAQDPKQRDALVMAHVDLVRSMASRLGRRLPSQVELSELVSVGVLGLIEAANRYQPSLGVPFDAFARRRIHGAMLDALRGLDWVPRSLRKLQRDVDGAMSKLRHTLGREPEAEEIAAALGVSTDDYEAKLDDLRLADLAAVQAAGTGEESAGLLEVAIDDEGPYRQLERRELRARLVDALAQLPERERQILALSYEEELTLAEIGQVIGVGESRVSQLRTQAVSRLRSMMQEWLRPVEAH
ncbi:MAG TPA: RNA polymerase sigma factor FliA [Vicinamibacterales bacterium]|jgi:RNA polymerase sigma factor for flagellar operon FliA|nr:RNA polymerase sigma factor FliA [Vicinamibacterales bacterium]